MKFFLAIDLLDKMLQLDPYKRISSTEALNHQYVEKFHDESDEPTGETYLDMIEESQFSINELTRNYFI